MRLKNITATPQPYGNRMDLKWVNPDPDQYPGVRVVRREGTHPTSPEDGVLVVEEEELSTAVDQNLKGEIVYYYTLFPYKGDPPEYHFDHHNRVSAMAASPYNMAGQMYDLLPGIYHRYDTKLPPEKFQDRMLEEDRETGQLRRFLDLPGSQLDQLYSFARAMLDLYNLNKVDGHLLPLLAEWIGWQTDYRPEREVEDQRNEIRSAPHIYRTIGIIPTVEATVKRLIGWESRTKEFVHNVFLSNRPERLNIWTCQRSDNGEWSEPTEPLSLDFAYEGRPTAVPDGDGTLWLFYHTYKKHYDANKKKWRDTWDIWYKTCDENQGWAHSQPFTNRILIDKHPTAVRQGETLWVFWDTYDEANQKWYISYRKRIDGRWSAITEIKTFVDLDIAPDWMWLRSWSEEYPDHCTVNFTSTPIDTKFRTWHIETQRRRPWAVVDSNDGLWLFWLEKVNTQWQLKYKRHKGTWGAASSFPLDNGEDPRVEIDLFVLFHPNQSIWVFWARKEPTGQPGQTRWSIAYRVKSGIDPNVSDDWGEIHTLPKDTKDTPHYHDREPAAIIDVDGNIELFWSSNRDGSWSIWRNTLDIVTHNWGTPEQVTNNPYSQRDPLPLLDKGRLLIYRSNESLCYTSEDYKATDTVDFRYAGCTTIDTRNMAKINLKGWFEDFQTYTYDSGKNGKRIGDEWYSRDTVGIYLIPDTEEQKLIIQNRNLIEKALKSFLPIQMQAVFIIPAVHKEFVYTYNHPTVKPQRFIGEQFFDSTITDVYSGLSDVYKDKAPDWIWLRSWSEEYPGHHTVNFSTIPVDTKFRTWHIALEEGGMK